MNPPSPRGQQGFSLIEMILFIVVIGILAVAFMKAITGGLSDPDLPRKMTQAAMLVQETMEEIYHEAADPNLTDLTNMPAPFNTTPDTDNPVDASFSGFARTTTYTSIAAGSGLCPTSATGCRMYTVKVSAANDATTVYAQADLYLVK